MTSSQSPLNPTPSKLRDQREGSGASPVSNTSRNRRSMYTDADMDMLNSGSESVENDVDDRETDESAEHSSGTVNSEDGQKEPGFVARFAEVSLSLCCDIFDMGVFACDRNTSYATSTRAISPLSNSSHSSAAICMCPFLCYFLCFIYFCNSKALSVLTFFSGPVSGPPV